MTCNHLIRKLSLSLSFLLMMQLTACGSSSSITDDSSQSTTTEVPETEYLAAEDFGGKTITVLAGNAIGQNYPFFEILAEEENGETINDAVIERNRYLEDKYNIQLEAMQIEPGGGKFLNVLRTEASSGSGDFDLTFIHPTDAFSAALQGYLYPIDSLPHIDSSQDWWLSYFNDAASVKGTNYFLGGDMNIALFAATGLVYFNKTVQEKYQIEDLYNLVEAGDFTVDKFASLCRTVTADLDGDTVLGDADVIGYRGNSYSFQMFLYGFGELLIKKDSNEALYLDFSESMTERIIRAIEVLNDKPYVQQPNLEAVGFPGFMEDRALFMTQPAYQFSVMRDMKSDYGILPLPKYDKEQKEYFSQIHTTWSSVTAVPITVSDTDCDMLGKLIEDMAYISHKIIRPAFYDTMLRGKYSRDEQSGIIMDLIFDNIIIDTAYLMTGYQGFNFDSKTRTFATNGTTDIASFAAEVTDMYNEAIKSVNENW